MDEVLDEVSRRCNFLDIKTSIEVAYARKFIEPNFSSYKQFNFTLNEMK